MFKVHLLDLNTSIEEVLKVQGNKCFVILSGEYFVVPRFVEYAFMQAFKTFEKGENAAKSINLEWLCKLALTKNVTNAVSFTKPNLNEVCLATVNCFETEKEIREIGTPLKVGKEFREKAEETLREKYNIPPKALGAYSLESILIEKAAVENL